MLFGGTACISVIYEVLVFVAAAGAGAVTRVVGVVITLATDLGRPVIKNGIAGCVALEDHLHKRTAAKAK